MQPNNNTNIKNQSYTGIHFNQNTYDKTEKYYHPVEQPTSMIYDPASTYLSYKTGSDIGNQMYPSMTVIPNTSIGCEISPSKNQLNGESDRIGSPYYGQLLRHGSNSEINPAKTQNQSIAATCNTINSSSKIKNHTNHEASHTKYSHPTKRISSDHNNSNSTIYSFNSLNGIELKQTKTDKASKGLRHFSMKVCEKVQQKKITTYNEVADELVNEFGETDKGPGNEQNIRRRVYDALNVLMAMNIISKDKKEIRWLGLPSNSAQEHQRLRNEGTEIFEVIKNKLKTIYELIIQQVSLQNLITHNKTVENDMGYKMDPEKCIQLPFLAISTSKSSNVVCKINDKKDKYDITFSSDFKIFDDSEILKKLGLGCNLDSPNCTIEDLNRSLRLVPPNLSYYVKAMAGRSVGEFQEHILSRRGYLVSDNLMEFYNKINQSIFDDPQHYTNLPTSRDSTNSPSDQNQVSVTTDNNTNVSHNSNIVKDKIDNSHSNINNSNNTLNVYSSVAREVCDNEASDSNNNSSEKLFIEPNNLYHTSVSNSSSDYDTLNIKKNNS